MKNIITRYPYYAYELPFYPNWLAMSRDHRDETSRNDQLLFYYLTQDHDYYYMITPTRIFQGPITYYGTIHSIIINENKGDERIYEHSYSCNAEYLLEHLFEFLMERQL